MSATTFHNLGATTQMYTVPANTTYVVVQAWGAGGGSFASYSPPQGAWSIAGPGGTGGSGGFVSAKYNVNPGDALTITVGSGGVGYRKYWTFNAGLGGWPGGGNGGAGGGGYTRVQTPYGDVWAGGGGGSGSCGDGGHAAYSWGGTSGTVIDSETNADPNSSPAGGGGGTLTSGGTSAVPGSQGALGQGGTGHWAGGGGGGGWGGLDSVNDSSDYYYNFVTTGGGGGSSNATGAASNVTMTLGMYSTSQAYYPGNGVAIGGTNGGGGGDGAVVILAYSGPVSAPTITSATTANIIQNQTVSYIITGTPSPASFGATGLPAGLSVNPTTGRISGSVAAPGTYTSTISATNRGGTGQATLTWNVAADTTAPPTPLSVQASNVSLGACQLTWSASIDNVATTVYEVSRNGNSLGVTPLTTYAVTGLTPGTTYSLTVRAGDAAGNWSAWSTPVTVTVSSDTLAPLAATGLAALGNNATNLTLMWSPGSDNVSVTSYTVYRDGVQIGTTSELVFVDTGLTPGGSHTYTITASDGAGNQSAASSAVSAATNASYTGDADHDGIPDAVEALIFPTGHGTVTIDQANTLQAKIYHPIR